jgi:hypothetical protein
VISRGAPALIQSVEKNEIPVSLACKLVDEVPDKKEQSRLAKEGKKDEPFAIGFPAWIRTPRRHEIAKSSNSGWPAGRSRRLRKSYQSVKVKLRRVFQTATLPF